MSALAISTKSPCVVPIITTVKFLSYVSNLDWSPFRLSAFSKSAYAERK